MTASRGFSSASMPPCGICHSRPGKMISGPSSRKRRPISTRPSVPNSAMPTLGRRGFCSDIQDSPACRPSLYQMQKGAARSLSLYAVAENAEPGWLIWTAVDTEVDSDRSIEMPPVEKSTTNVTCAVCVAEEAADTLPASEDAVTL